MKRRDFIKLPALAALPSLTLAGKPQKYVYIHECGEPLFYYDHIPEYGDVISQKYATNLDGTKPEKGEAITCKCEMEFGLSSSRLFKL